MYGVLEFYKECQRAGRQADHRHRGLHGPRAPHASARRAGAGSTTPAATPRAASKLYYHLTLLAENDAGLPQPDPARPAWPSSRATTTSRGSTGSCSSSHHEGLIATTGCLGGHVLQSLLQRRRRRARSRRPAGCRTSSARTTCSSSCRTTASPAQRDTNPQLIEIARKIGAPLLATNDSHYTHREDHEAHDALLCVQTGATAERPEALQVRGRRALPEDRRRDALPVPRAPRGVRQHAVDRRAGRRRDRVRQAAAARLPAARGLRRRRRLPRPPHAARAPSSGGATTLPDVGRRAPRPTSSRSSTTWASARTS